MKKLLYLITMAMLLCTLQGCRKHVYHTYYGDIDIDTMEVYAYDLDSTPCYAVKIYDSLTVEKTKLYVGHGPVVICFNPKKNVYYKQFPSHDEHGNVVVKLDPETGEYSNDW